MSGEGKFIDFDEAWAEQSAQAPSIKVYGETIRLPASQPVAVMLFEARIGSDTPLTVDVVKSLLEPYVGDRVQTWIDGMGLQRDQLVDLFRRINTLYRDDDAGEAEAPEAGAPDADSSSSSTGGDGSKPTSDASTDST